MYERMNEYFIFYSSSQIQYSKNSNEQNCVDWTERLKKHLQLLHVVSVGRFTVAIVVVVIVSFHFAQ